MPAPILPLALFAAGASAIGSVNANRANRQIARDQNALNYKMFQEQNKFNLDMWQRENEYNTAFNQRKRYEEAGINPNLAMSNITPGMAQGVTSSSPAPAVGYQYNDPVAPAVSQGLEAYVSEMQAQKLRAEKAETEERAGILAIQRQREQQRLDAQIENTKSNTNLNNANAKKAEADTRFADYSIERLKELTPLQKEQISASIAEVASRINLNAVTAELKRFELTAEAPARVANSLAAAMYLRAQGKLSLEQVKLVGAQVGLIEAQESGVRWDNNQKALFQANLKHRIELMDKDLAVGTKVKLSNIDYMDNQTAINWVQVATGFAGQLAGAGAAALGTNAANALGREFRGQIKDLKTEVQGLKSSQK